MKSAGNVPADFFHYMKKPIRYILLNWKRKSGDIEVRDRILLVPLCKAEIMTNRKGAEDGFRINR